MDAVYQVTATGLFHWRQQPLQIQYCTSLAQVVPLAITKGLPLNSQLDIFPSSGLGHALRCGCHYPWAAPVQDLEAFFSSFKCFKPCARTLTEASVTVSEVTQSQVTTRVLSGIGLQFLSSHHQPIFAWRNNPLVGSAVASRFITLPTSLHRGTLNETLWSSPWVREIVCQAMQPNFAVNSVSLVAL